MLEHANALLPEFIPFPKIPRMKRTMIVTEKIDGTNAGILIEYLPRIPVLINPDTQVSLDGWIYPPAIDGKMYRMLAASRNRWVNPSDDNYGFAKWIFDNAAELTKLGPGMHWGEWWGQGIQRGYGLTEKRFSLFNTARWGNHNPNTPKCCHVVPVLNQSEDFGTVQGTLDRLRSEGSIAAPGFLKPEGVVVYHSASRSYFKVTLEKDNDPKSKENSVVEPQS